MVHKYDLVIIGQGIAVLLYAAVNVVRHEIGLPLLMIAAGGAALAATRAYKILDGEQQQTYAEKRTLAATISFLLVFIGFILVLVSPFV